MPYDPRPVTEGGNRGIDILFSRTAPKGKFRVIGVDTFDGGDWKYDDYKTLAAAKKFVDEETKGKQMLKVYVYDDKGACVYSSGSF